MEPDRFQHSPTVYTIGLISMISSMALFGLGAYALPNIAFGLTYRIPEFIFYWINLIHLAYGFTEKKAGLLVLMIIFALGFITSSAGQVLSFYFGSSQGSKDKTKELEGIMKK